MADARERAFIAQPFIGPGARIIASPFQFATNEDDNLRIESANSKSGVVLAIQGRRLTAAGDIEPFAYTHTPNTDRSVKAQDYKLGAGALLNLTIFASSGAPVIGQTFVSARFIRGLTGATIVLGTLLAGYVTGAQHLAYPGSPIGSSLDGGGWHREITGTTPAAGAPIDEFCPTGARWELVSVRAQFTTSATVATRRPRLTLSGASVLIAGMNQVATMAASDARTFYWAQGLAVSAAWSADHHFQGLPTGINILAGGLFDISADNLQAGDQFTAPTYEVREWLQVQS